MEVHTAVNAYTNIDADHQALHDEYGFTHANAGTAEQQGNHKCGICFRVGAKRNGIWEWHRYRCSLHTVVQKLISGFLHNTILRKLCAEWHYTCYGCKATISELKRLSRCPLLIPGMAS